MESKYVPPRYRVNAFHCPHCGVYAHQRWSAEKDECKVRTPSLLGFAYVEEDVPGLAVSFCTHCKKYALWIGSKMIYPHISGAPLPNPDMPSDVRSDYEEATQVLQASPRAAAALLRLAIQKLSVHLGQPGKNINDDIAALVKQGLKVQIQQALDVVRVIGNNAVHPGELDIKDDRDTCASLFTLVNMIVDDRITQPKAVASLFDRLPQGAKAQIEKRNGNP